MLSDEAEIRALVRNWQSATQAGDTEAVLRLMTDDVVFLVPGRPPMHKAEFAALSPVPLIALLPVSTRFSMFKNFRRSRLASEPAVSMPPVLVSLSVSVLSMT